MSPSAFRRALGGLLGAGQVEVPTEPSARDGYSAGRRALVGLLGVQLTGQSGQAPNGSREQAMPVGGVSGHRTASRGSATEAAGDYAAGRVARRDILVPGDPPPPPTPGSAYYDFRGVLSLREVPRELQGAGFPLGRYIDPARGSRDPIALSASVVAEHAAVVGPAGAGKTTGIIVPWIIAGLRAGWSVVTIDVKGDLVGKVEDAVRQSGQELSVPLATLDYRNPATSIRWNWMAELDSDSAIDNAVQSIIGMEPPQNSEPYFFNVDRRILRSLLVLATMSSPRNTLTASRLLRTLQDRNNLVQWLNRYPASSEHQRLHDLETLTPDEYVKRTSGVSAKLDALAMPMIEAVTNQAGMHAQDVLYTPSLLSIVAPLQDGPVAATLSSLFINQLLNRAYDRFGSHDGVPLLLVLDEAALLENRVDFQALLSVGRAAHVSVLIAMQDVAQFKDENERSAIFGNCGTTIFLPGVSVTSAQLLSKRLGEHPVPTSSASIQPAPTRSRSRTSKSTQIQMAPVLGIPEIVNLQDLFGQYSAIVDSRSLFNRPFLVDLTQPASSLTESESPLLVH
jgi:type IV secretory pathway TraG/TraD family ATPase VirD4